MLAGGTELRANAAQQLQLELVDHQLEQHHLCIACIEDAQQRVDGVGRVGSGLHRRLLCRACAVPAIGGAPETSSYSGSGRQLWLMRAHRHAPVDAFEKHRQLGRRERHAAFSRLRPDEATTLETLGQQQ